jgi:hypothetical protein
VGFSAAVQVQEVSLAKNVLWRGLLAIGMMLALGACGVYGPKGNDTGGIIPWSPAAELTAMDTAQGDCGRYNKRAVITTVTRNYGDYIVYDCRWKQ